MQNTLISADIRVFKGGTMGFFGFHWIFITIMVYLVIIRYLAIVSSKEQQDEN